MQKHVVSVLSFGLLSISSSAQWTNNSTINTPVAIATKGQSNMHMVTDNANGVILAWEDNRDNLTNSTDIYAQRIDKNGVAKWATNGVALCNNASLQKSVVMVDAGNGAMIAAWQDLRAGNSDIYAQKIDSLGNVLWAVNGVAVTNKTTTQKNVKLISDNAGGAIIVWEDSVNSYYDIYAQRLNSAGVAQWASNGVVVCNATLLQINPKIDTDNAGGAIITWQDKRNGNDYDIYAQRINNAGIAQWASNGVVVCNATGTQNNPRIEPDGANGAIIAWADKRNTIDYNIYAQRISATGTAIWANNGVAVCTATDAQSGIDMKFLGTTILVSWKDVRSGNYQIYSQLLNLQGVPQLATNGIALSNNSLKAINPNTIVDSNGGAIVAWQDSVAGNWNIKTQQLSNLGALQWATGGVVVSNAANNQINVAQVSNGLGGAIFGWEDNRSGIDYDIYTQNITNNGILNSVQAPTTNNTTIIAYPNPVHDVLRLTNVALNSTTTIYTTAGAIVYYANSSTSITNEINCTLFNNGLYFYTITSENKIQKGKFIIDNN